MEMELHPHRNTYRAIIISLFLGLALISLALILNYQRNGMVREPSAVQTKMPELGLTSIPVNKKAIAVGQKETTEVQFAVVTAQTGVNSYTKGQSISLQIVGSSNDHKALGYDVLLSGGRTSYDVVSVKSLLPEFTVLKFLKDDHLTITAVLKPSAKEKKVFDATPLVELVITPKQVGDLDIRVLSEQGKETSKIVSVGALGNTEKLPAPESDNLRLDIKQ